MSIGLALLICRNSFGPLQCGNDYTSNVWLLADAAIALEVICNILVLQYLATGGNCCVDVF